MEQSRLDEYTDKPGGSNSIGAVGRLVAYTGRHPGVTDAWALGYTTGVREDCRFQIDSYPNVSLPVLFLNNNFHDPDLDRFLDRVDRLISRLW
ncbi:DUF6610 family protein [Halalkalicoccus salilacus]|uniref:DUF6610 family protein n=1 Tax=Halalkalicoccus TaxID=332246 RepID=UPI00360B2519